MLSGFLDTLLSFAKQLSWTYTTLLKELVIEDQLSMLKSLFEFINLWEKKNDLNNDKFVALFELAAIVCKWL